MLFCRQPGSIPAIICAAIGTSATARVCSVISVFPSLGKDDGGRPVDQRLVVRVDSEVGEDQPVGRDHLAVFATHRVFGAVGRAHIKSLSAPVKRPPRRR